MIVVEEYFSILPAWRDAFDARCSTLAGLMACRRGCRRVEVARSANGPASHLLWSVWDSLEAFRLWTRTNAFVLTASGALPQPARQSGAIRTRAVFAAPKQLKVNHVLRSNARPCHGPAPLSFVVPVLPQEIAHAHARY